MSILHIQPFCSSVLLWEKDGGQGDLLYFVMLYYDDENYSKMNTDFPIMIWLHKAADNQ